MRISDWSSDVCSSDLLDPDNARAYTQNARAYGKCLRQMRAAALAKLTQAPNAELRVATVHAAYDYLLREFGLEVTAVVEPAHGIEPSPKIGSASGRERVCLYV